MIIFNHSIIFKNEPSLNDDVYQENIEIVFVKKTEDVLLWDTSYEEKPWIEMSSQMVRFHRLDNGDDFTMAFSWMMEVKNVLTLIWDVKERHITYKVDKNYTAQRLQFWVFHTFFPMILDLERKYRILHVGGVEIEGKPVLFSAFSYGGKSTLTDYFIQKGHSLLSDDTVAIENRDDTYYAIASYPFHRPFRESETLGYPVEIFSKKPKPLHAVYVLEKAEHDAMVEVRELFGIEKFRAFHYTAFIVFDLTKKERFVFFSEMARKIAVYKITVPWDLERLDEVYEAICTHTHTLK